MNTPNKPKYKSKSEMRRHEIMNEKNKPREWHINGPKWVWQKTDWCNENHLDVDEQVHVIEYSAYEALEKLHQNCNQRRIWALEEKNKKITALEQRCASLEAERDDLRDGPPPEKEIAAWKMTALAHAKERDALKSEVELANLTLENLHVENSNSFKENQQLRSELARLKERLGEE